MDATAPLAALAVALLWVLSLFIQPIANLFYSLHLTKLGVHHLLRSNDKRWNKKALPDSGALTDVVATKQFIFIRHGESAWNEVFNRGFGPSFPVRLLTAIMREVGLAASLDSVFVDSPLNGLGVSQAAELQAWVEAQVGAEPGSSEAVLYGSGGAGQSVLVSSNLRRALATGTIGLWHRLKRTQEKVKVLSCLQEITFNIDGVALAKPRTAPALSSQECRAIGVESAAFAPERFYDAVNNAGDKPVRSKQGGLGRLKEFAKFAFSCKEETVIAAGHSLYFKNFFATFLPKASEATAKTNKMSNCCVVAFSISKGVSVDPKTNQKVVWYRIEEDTIRPLYLDFEIKKKKKN